MLYETKQPTKCVVINHVIVGLFAHKNNKILQLTTSHVNYHPPLCVIYLANAKWNFRYFILNIYQDEAD